MRLTTTIYRGLNWMVPNKPKMTTIICRKLPRIGAHWKPRKSKICLSNAASCKKTHKQNIHFLVMGWTKHLVFSYLHQASPVSEQSCANLAIASEIPSCSLPSPCLCFLRFTLTQTRLQAPQSVPKSPKGQSRLRQVPDMATVIPRVP